MEAKKNKRNEIEKMKIYLRLILILITFFVFSCKQKTKQQKTEITEQPIELKKTPKPNQNSMAKKVRNILPKILDYKCVIARSGLNYRDIPNGNVLGKFPLNTHLEIIEHTKKFDQIKDDKKIIKGEWVGILRYLTNQKFDTVYVFNAFLSYNCVQSDIKLYYASSFYNEKDGRTRTAFLNLSETYFENAYNENGDKNRKTMFTENDLEKDTIRLNKGQRNKFLKISNISELDKVYVYLISSDEIQIFNVKDLPVIACMNPYGPSRDYINDEYDYMLGFDLAKSLENWDDNLVFIGKENPFQTGKLKPIIWTKIKNNQFPIIKDLDKKGIDLSSYLFATAEYDYFLQKLTKNLSSYHLVVIDKNSKLEILNRYYYDGESTYLTELNIEENENKELQQSQWTGKLIKNKATVIFGFVDQSFGCPSITILDETEPRIPILCDNRH